MDPSRRQRTQTRATAEEQALDQIAKEVSVKKIRLVFTYVHSNNNHWSKEVG